LKAELDELQAGTKAALQATRSWGRSARHERHMRALWGWSAGLRPGAGRSRIAPGRRPALREFL